MTTILTFKNFVSLLAEPKFCIFIYDKTNNETLRNYIYSKELFDLILKNFGDYYVDQISSDSSLVSFVLVNPEDWEDYKMEKYK